jgi:hypothetical protein
LNAVGDHHRVQPLARPDHRYPEGCRANNCGLIAATIFTLIPRSSSEGSTLTRFRVGIVPRT